MFSKIRSLIFKLDPELAHTLAIKFLKPSKNAKEGDAYNSIIYKGYSFLLRTCVNNRYITVAVAFTILVFAAYNFQFVKQNFSSFIIGKDALFSRLTTGFQQEMEILFTSDAAQNPLKLQEQQVALTEKYENLSKKVNAEFNTQFVTPYAQQQNSDF